MSNQPPKQFTAGKECTIEEKEYNTEYKAQLNDFLQRSHSLS